MEVTVRLVPLADYRDTDDRLLTPGEAGRAASYRLEADRRRFVLATAVLKRLVAAMTGVAPAEVPIDRGCPDCGRQHGRPRVRLPDAPYVSIAHAGDLVAVAAGTGAPVGIDVELQHHRLLEIADQLLGPGESAGDVEALTRLWCRKEAVLKALGTGLREPMTGFSATGAEPVALLGRVCRVADLDVAPGYAAAVAVAAPDPIRLR